MQSSTLGTADIRASGGDDENGALQELAHSYDCSIATMRRATPAA
jgi:hypothetical protein